MPEPRGPYIKTGDYTVESIGRGKRLGRTKVFRSRAAANKYARSEATKGRGIVVDKITESGQRTVAQKNLRYTGLSSLPGGKEQYGKDYGSIRASRKAPVKRKRSKPRRRPSGLLGYKPISYL
jgi:hypothetical protein